MPRDTHIVCLQHIKALGALYLGNTVRDHKLVVQRLPIKVFLSSPSRLFYTNGRRRQQKTHHLRDMHGLLVDSLR